MNYLLFGVDLRMPFKRTLKRATLLAAWTILPLLLSVPVRAAAPVLDNRPGDIWAFEGTDLEIHIQAHDPDGDSIYIRLDDVPIGVTVDSMSILWTPSYLQVGVDTIIYSVVSFPIAQSVTDTIQITVLDAGVAESYTDNTQQTGLGEGGVGNAAAWADYNRDNVPDVYIANAGTAGKLFAGDSTGHYSEKNILPLASGDAGAAAWGDYDNDGYPDLYVVNSGLFGGRRNYLFHNDSGYVFTDVSNASGTADNGLGKAATWVDFDTDGDLDLYVVNFGSANRLFSNNGNGTFYSMADSAGVAHTGDGVSGAWCDYNGDLYPDLYLVNEHGNNVLYRNNGDSTFTDVTTTAGVGHTGNGGTAAWGDYDNDNDFDLYLGNKDSLQVLLSNDGDGTFTRLGSSAGLNTIGSARSAIWIDFNQDGHLDLMVAYADSSGRLYQNNGDSTFYNVSPAVGINNSGYWSGVTWTDPLGRGAPDLYAVLRDKPNVYFQAKRNARYLGVDLKGHRSNRFGYGAKVRIVAGSTKQVRWISGGNGSMSLPRALFGVALNTAVDSLSVIWPSGLRYDTTSVATNQLLLIAETDSIFPVIDSTTVYPDTSWLTGPYPVLSKVTDNNSITVSLMYNTDRSTIYNRVAMSAAGGDFYTGNIPGQSSGTRVQYFIRAVDSVGHTVYDPPIPQDSVFMFSVDDSVPVVSSLTVIEDTGNETGPYPLTATASDNDSLRAVYLVWSIYQSGQLVEYDSLSLAIQSADSTGFHYASEFSGRPIGTQINYYIRAVDLAGNYTHLPSTAPDSAYSFRVAHFSQRYVSAFAIRGKGVGLAVADYDNDGVMDVFAATQDSTDYLFHGLPSDSTFTDVSSLIPGNTTPKRSIGGVWGDYDNDGDADLYIFGLDANVLVANDGDGTFTDVTTTSGTGSSGESWAAGWVDYDNDNYLDLFVVNNDGADKLFHNRGDGTFADTTSFAGLAGAADAIGAVWADYDNDGDQDLYVVYYGSGSKLYRNNGSGTFSDVTSSAGVAGGQSSVSASWFDYNSDGRIDLYLVQQDNVDRLYANDGDGTFSAMDMQSIGLSVTPGGFSPVWGDFDNDGAADLFISRGEAGLADIGRVFRGDGSGGFTDFTFKAGITDLGEYRGASWLDYNNDGNLDLIINNQAGRIRLYKNLGHWDNNYLNVKLDGRRGNNDGRGARILLSAGGNNQWRQFGTGEGFVSQQEPLIHFGLGNSSTIDSLIVSWPYGITQRSYNLSANRNLTVAEQDTIYPSIVSVDSIGDQYTTPAAIVVNATVLDRDSSTTVNIDLSLAGPDSLVAVSMTRQSVSPSGGAFLSEWNYTLPALPFGSTRYWRIRATDSRGVSDSSHVFTYSAVEDTSGPEIKFVSVPDSIVPDTLGPYNFRIRMLDDIGISSGALTVYGRDHYGDSLGWKFDTLFTAVKPDSVEWRVSIPGQKLDTRLNYFVVAEDLLGTVDTTSLSSLYIGPYPGHVGTGTEVVVTDIMRLVQIILGAATVSAGMVDSLALDLDGNGRFTTADLISLLDLWSGASLASVKGSRFALLSGLSNDSRGALIEISGNTESSFILLGLKVEPAEAAASLVVEPMDGFRLERDLISGEVDNSENSYNLALLLSNVGGGTIMPGRAAQLKLLSRDVEDVKISLVMAATSSGKFSLGSNALSVKTSALPKSFSLSQNAPNPFNPSTTISFALPESVGTAARVSLKVYNIRGALIATLIDGTIEPGYHSVVWNGNDSRGNHAASGIYLYRLSVPGFTKTKKMILLK